MTSGQSADYGTPAASPMGAMPQTSNQGMGAMPEPQLYGRSQPASLIQRLMREWEIAACDPGTNFLHRLFSLYRFRLQTPGL